MFCRIKNKELGTMKKLNTEELIKRKGDLQILKNKPRHEVYLILDNIRSVHNVGAMFRTADAARVKKIFLCGITAHPPRPDLEKTALQTIEHVPYKYFENTIDVIEKLKKKNVSVVALEQTDESIDYNKFKYKKPIAIVVGNEVEGIGDGALALCDAYVDIPMHGVANSLNVATSAGIILYKAIEK